MSRQIPVVDDYMARDLITLRPEDDIHHAVKVLLEERISGAPVVDPNDNLVGVLSKKDCLKVIYNASYYQDWSGRVDDYMSRDVSTIESGTDIIAAADEFLTSAFRRFPVTRHGRMIGQISRCDILLALEEQWGVRRK